MTFIESPTKRSRPNSSAYESPKSLRKSEPVCDIASKYKLRAKIGTRTSFSCSQSPSPSGDPGSYHSSQSDASTLTSISHAPFLIGPDSEAEAESIDFEDDSEDYYDRITWTSKNSIAIRNTTTKGYEKYNWSCEEVYNALMAMAFGETSSCDVTVGLIIDLPFSEKTIQSFFELYLPRYSSIPMRHLKTIFWRARLDIGEKHNQNMVAMKREARRSEMIQAYQMYNMRKAEGAKTPEAMQFVCSQIKSADYNNTIKDVEGDRLGSKDSGVYVEDDTKPKSQDGLEQPYHRTVPIMLRPIDRRLEQNSDRSNVGYTVTLRGGIGSEGWSESTNRGIDSSWTEHTRSTDLGYTRESEGSVPEYNSTDAFGVQTVATTEFGVAQNYSHQNNNANFDQPSHSFLAETVEKGKGKRKQTETTFPAESPPKKFKSVSEKSEVSARWIPILKKSGRSSTTKFLDIVQVEGGMEDFKAANFFSRNTRQGYSICDANQRVSAEFDDEELEVEDGDHDVWSAQWNK